MYSYIRALLNLDSIPIYLTNWVVKTKIIARPNCRSSSAGNISPYYKMISECYCVMGKQDISLHTTGKDSFLTRIEKSIRRVYG